MSLGGTMYRFAEMLVIFIFSLTMLGNAQQPSRVSLVQLIASPEKFDGKIVTVDGFLDMNREGDLLYLHEVDSKNLILANAIWINRTEQMGKNRLNLNMKYVKVVGKFKVGYKHSNLPENGIFDVQSTEVWSDPSNPIGLRIKNIPGVNATP
jgi:hypothetical protein